MHFVFLTLGLALSGAVFDQAASAPQKLAVELRLVVDQKVVDRYALHTKNGEDIKGLIKQDITIIIHEVNTNYLSTLSKHNIDIDARIKDVVFMHSGFYSKKELAADTASLSDVFKRFTAYAGNHSNTYDFNILYSGFDFMRSNMKLTGTGYSSTICNPSYNTAVMTYDATQQSAQRTAAFILKSVATYKPSCMGKNRNYADGSPRATSKTRFEFSPCIIQKVKAKIAELNSGKNCLTEKHTTAFKIRSVDDRKDSDIFSAVNICKRQLKADASVCEYFAPYDSDKMCEQLYCTYPNDRMCHTATPMEGMVCSKANNSHRCKKGKCVKV